MDYTTSISSFISAIQKAGINAPDSVIADGQIHRFSSNGKPNDKSGYYVIHITHNGVLVGIFGCWRNGVQHTWCSVERNLESFEVNLEINHMLNQANLAKEKTAKARAEYAINIIQTAQPAESTHPYAKRKGNISLKGVYWKRSIPCSEFFDNIESKGTLDDVLLIPVRDKSGSIISLQAIAGNGSKFFLSGGATKEGMHTIHGDTDIVYIAEGFATAASIHDATGKSVVCAFNASNLLTLAPVIKDLFPTSQVIVAGDNDTVKEAEGKGNKGKSIAESLFNNEGLAYTLPTFDSTLNGSDWNDYACYYGKEALLSALKLNMIAPRNLSTFDDSLECLRNNVDDAEAFDLALQLANESGTLVKSRQIRQLKEVTNVPIKDMNARLNEIKKANEPDDLSHSDIAQRYIAKLGQTELIGAYGCMWTYQEHSGIWIDKPLSKLSAEIAREFNTQSLCKRVSDYKSISSFAYDVQEQQDFFENAPLGVNTPRGFLCIKEGKIVLESPTPLHRARHRLSFTPSDKGTKPKVFLQMLYEAFLGNCPEEQTRQLRMCFGLSLFGVLPTLQRAVFLYGAAGSGKSVVLKVLASMLHSESISAVSPLVFDNEYQRAAIAGKRFNLVPELEKDQKIPSADFKSIIGGDKISAREPYGKVFTFTPSASNWFNGNYYPKTTDCSEGFYRRWVICDFINTKPAAERDPGLLNCIVEKELPAILRWAMDGVEDYLENGLYFSPAHAKSISQWKAETNSVQGWLNDSEVNSITFRDSKSPWNKRGQYIDALKLTDAYKCYREWCVQCGFIPYKKPTFVQNMAQLGQPLSIINGYSVFPNLSSNLSLLIRSIEAV